MSVSPLGSRLDALLGGVARPTDPRAPQGARVPTGPAAPSAPPAATTAPSLTAPSAALPAAPPSGVDPELWSVLTHEERVYFAKVGSLGPLTYGRGAAPGTPPPPPTLRGGRIDVKG